MQFNPAICATIHFTRKRNPLMRTYELHGHSLANVTSGKYLVVQLHEKMLWISHFDEASKKANN